MRIIISNRTDVPIYEQIKEQIKTAILSGEISEGELLPSIRGLAKDLKISVITSTRAYNDLETEGFISNVQGKGCYVMPQNKEMIRESKLREIEENLLHAVAAAKLAAISKTEFMEILNILCREENYE